ncbi:MAG: hypothetical protein DMG27_19895 [Acidobacteria bacterium]|nr:MAG: hypothetical protein DMG27_19895 [Acidobacteriota bacterium]
MSAGLLLTLLLAATTLVWRAAHLQAVGSDEIPFRKHTIDLGRSESVDAADINRDGRLDVVSGENWYEQAPPAERGAGPRWIKHHFRDLPYADGYIEDLSDLAIDVNGDGYPDIVSCSYWQQPLTWWENPQGQDKPWRKTVIQTGSPVEFAFLVDLLNTGKATQLLPQFGDENFPLSWYEVTGSGADAKWTRHIVSPQSYGHGIGAGDVNGDGRTDIITPKGWFEAPSDPRNGQWIFHQEFNLGATGFIYVEDVNGEKGSIYFDLEDMHQLQYFNHEDPAHVQGWRTILVTGAEHPYMANWWVPGCVIGYEHTFVNALADFLKGLEKGERVRPDFRDALETQAVAEAVLESARTERWVSPETGDLRLEARG